MVERLHRTLKQAIRCHVIKWTESLPVVLLGLRACIKEDLNASCAEMVIGKTIVLPGEFFEPSSQTPTDPSEFLLRLRETFRTLKPTPAIHLPHVLCTQPSKPAPMSLLGSKD
ncbi:gag-Pol polyprotein [Trichonephila clavipes]|nr:gag-Pol polyprotein [Trichonephila clavipes]